MDYAGAAWQPWLSKTSFEKLESTQRFAGRIITGHLKTTPNECILLDTKLSSMMTKCRQNAVIALEKSKRLPPNNPRRQVIERQVKQRTTKPSWRNGAIKAWEKIFENEDHTRTFPPERKPWTDTTKISFRYSETKKSDSESEQRKAGEQAILETGDQDITFYMDVSAAGGNCLSGAGVVEYENDREPHELSYPAGRWTSSYQAELTAIEHALTMATDKPEQKKIRIITDSRSAVQKLEYLIHNNKPDTRTKNNIQGLLEKMPHNDQHLTMVWCPGHCNIDGNERADKCANEGSKLPQESVSHSFNTAKAVIRRHLKDPPIEHPLANKVYTNGPDRRKPMDKGLNREQQVTISRLCSGHHTQLNYWRKKTDLTSDDKCRLCGTAPETIQHIMEECPGMNDSRNLAGTWQPWRGPPLEALRFYERWSKRAGDA